MNGYIIAPVLLASFFLSCSTPHAAEEHLFTMLSSKQIKMQFAGKELTDEVHYAYRFDPNGQVAIVSMGESLQGRWRIVEDTLCVIREQSVEDCYHVWMAGNRVELRPGDDRPIVLMEGILQRPEPRQ